MIQEIRQITRRYLKNIKITPRGINNNSENSSMVKSIFLVV
jgi:hypothetical protein